MGSESAIDHTTIGFDDFELDIEAHQLRRAGRLLKLERIPNDILRLLIEHAGHVVSRDQIAERIWGKGVFLDTDNSINGAIRKIRLVLNDHPDHPRFIETIPGSGYRFIAPVRRSAAVDGVSAPDPAPPTTVGPTASVPAVRPTVRRYWLPLAALAIAIAGVGAWLTWVRPTPRTAAGGRVMLAVLPFENLTGDVDQEYFSDGLTEELIAHLGRLDPKGLGVIARTSVMRYKRTGNGLAKIGRELGVQYVLEGSVRRESNRVRIAAQLVQVNDQTHVWARQYDREQQSILSVQAEIADAVANEIQLTLGERRRAGSHAALSAQGYEAYDLYLRGRYFWNKRTKEGFTQAIELFGQATAIDPNHARAHAGLADAYALLGSWGHAPPAEVIPLARAAAIRALQIDERLAEAHTSLALISENHDWDWQKAEIDFRRAIELDPNYVTAHHWYAEYLAFQGRFDEALLEIGRARQLDPLSLIIATDHAAILYFSRQDDQAIQQFRSVLAVEPTFPRANLIVGAYAKNEQLADAIGHLEKWRKLEDSAWVSAWAAHLYGRAGRMVEARRALQRMEALIKSEKLYPSWLYATAYVGLGSNDEAIKWLQQACSDGSNALTSLKVDPMLDPLRGDPRFDALLGCVRLTS